MKTTLKCILQLPAGRLPAFDTPGLFEVGDSTTKITRRAIYRGVEREPACGVERKGGLPLAS